MIGRDGSVLPALESGNKWEEGSTRTVRGMEGRG